jgi:hypothetical protein
MKTFKAFKGTGQTTIDLLLRLTHGIINLAARDIDHRTFSRRAVKDSKALEQSERAVGAPAAYVA